MDKASWKLLKSLEEVHLLADRLGQRDPVIHNLLCSLLLRMSTLEAVHVRREQEADFELAWFSGMNLIVTELDFDGMLELAHRFEGAHLPGVVGPHESAEGFVEAYAAVAGIRPAKWIDQMIFRCDSLIPHRNVAGHARPLRLDDREWHTSAMQAFIAEAIPHESFDPLKFKSEFEDVVASRRFHVWEVDGKPCAHAGLSGQTPWSQRIGPVHTLPEERGKGYGSAITAHVTELIIAGGRTPCLYTDLSNPVSNEIYRRLGFTEVRKSLHAVYPA